MPRKRAGTKQSKDTQPIRTKKKRAALTLIQANDKQDFILRLKNILGNIEQAGILSKRNSPIAAFLKINKTELIRRAQESGALALKDLVGHVLGHLAGEKHDEESRRCAKYIIYQQILALNDFSNPTAISSDHGREELFARQIDALDQALLEFGTNQLNVDPSKVHEQSLQKLKSKIAGLKLSNQTVLFIAHGSSNNMLTTPGFLSYVSHNCSSLCFALPGPELVTGRSKSNGEFLGMHNQARAMMFIEQTIADAVGPNTLSSVSALGFSRGGVAVKMYQSERSQKRHSPDHAPDPTWQTPFHGVILDGVSQYMLSKRDRSTYDLDQTLSSHDIICGDRLLIHYTTVESRSVLPAVQGNAAKDTSHPSLKMVHIADNHYSVANLPPSSSHLYEEAVTRFCTIIDHLGFRNHFFNTLVCPIKGGGQLILTTEFLKQQLKPSKLLLTYDKKSALCLPGQSTDSSSTFNLYDWQAKIILDEYRGKGKPGVIPKAYRKNRFVINRFSVGPMTLYNEAHTHALKVAFPCLSVILNPPTRNENFPEFGFPFDHSKVALRQLHSDVENFRKLMPHKLEAMLDIDPSISTNDAIEVLRSQWNFIRQRAYQARHLLNIIQDKDYPDKLRETASQAYDGLMNVPFKDDYTSGSESDNVQRIHEAIDPYCIASTPELQLAAQAAVNTNLPQEFVALTPAQADLQNSHKTLRFLAQTIPTQWEDWRNDTGLNTQHLHKQSIFLRPKRRIKPKGPGPSREKPYQPPSQ